MYKIFLSSTARDLAEYREAVFQAICRMDGFHCIRMEDFGARDSMADDFCRQKVEECDVVVFIIGLCYGSSPADSEDSYTLQEYRAAVDTKRSRLVFMSPDDHFYSGYYREADELWQKQQAFRKQVAQERILDRFITPDELAKNVATALGNWAREQSAKSGKKETGTAISYIPTPSPGEKARKRYLEKLRQRCNVLPLGAIGGEEGAGEEVSLDQVYVTLNTRTLVSLPEEESTSRERQFIPQRDRPLSALQAATQTHRLVLLGDPGSGKSTFVRQLAAWMASACLGERDAPPGWEARWLPLLVILRELAPRLTELKLDGISGDKRSRLLLNAVREQWKADLHDLHAAQFYDDLEEELGKGRVVLIFDGLDEVPEHMRRCVRDTISILLRAYPGMPKFIVTSRIRSYTGNAKISSFTDHTLAPFNEEQIRQFVTAWYRAQMQLDRIEKDKAENNIQSLQDAALGELRELSANPMLLTTMAIIHQRDVGLPRERVRLYERVVEILLNRWQSHKGMAVSTELAQVLSDNRKLRTVLERLAYDAHSAQAGSAEHAGLLRKDILDLLERPAYLGEIGLASEFLNYVDQRAGLLIGYGGDEEGQRPHVYNFPHRTFQEYLAGCYMVSGRGIGREYWKRVAEGDYWYLAACLGAEELLFNRCNPEALLDLAYDLCPPVEPDCAAAWRAVLWSGQMAVLLGRDEVERDTGQPGGGVAFLQRLQPRLGMVLRGPHLGAIERAETGRVLARLGDPRPEVTTLDNMQFCYVPAGEFWMGSAASDDMAYDDEKWPGRYKPITLDYDYWICRYPITNAHFAAFVQSSGYKKEHYWPEAKAAGVWEDAKVIGWLDDEPRERPQDFGTPFNLPNYPVVGITWYEALAFTRWLTEIWREKGWIDQGMSMCLPSEVEWEKAARGGMKIPAEPVTRPIGEGLGKINLSLRDNDQSRRRYPWGDDPDPNRANYDDAKINATNAVGCFPGGLSPYGCEEMSGNVWEWTRSLRGNYPYPDDETERGKREDVRVKGSRVLRGGAFILSAFYVRCAFRLFNVPIFRDDFIGFRVVVSPSSSER